MNARKYARAAVAALLLVTAGGALAQAYPSKPITFLVGQPAGSGPDIMTRLFADSMSDTLGQRVLVVNRGGAGGILAAQALVQAPPDGYTVLFVLGAMHTVLPAMQQLPFDAIKDFEFISTLYVTSQMLLVSARNPANSVAEFIAIARSKPGGVNYGSPGIGSSAHLMGALLSLATGTPMTHVAYKTSAQAVIELIAGILDATYATAVVAGPQIAQGQLRALAVGSPTRIKQFPDVPTFKELGHGDTAVQSWFGIAAPRGTPGAIVGRLGAAVEKAAREPAAIKRAEADGVTLVTSSPEEIHKLAVSEHERLGQAVRRLKIRLE